jgi:hypothetical protein
MIDVQKIFPFHLCQKRTKNQEQTLLPHFRLYTMDTVSVFSEPMISILPNNFDLYSELLFYIWKKDASEQLNGH